MRAIIVVPFIVWAVAAVGCTPSECSDVLEKTLQIEEALRGELSAAREPAAALGETLAKAGPDWVYLRGQSEDLAQQIERAGKAPSSPGQGAHDARELKYAIDAWRDAAKQARAVCR